MLQAFIEIKTGNLMWVTFSADVTQDNFGLVANGPYDDL